METTSIPLDKLGIPPEFARYVDASSPREVKIFAARGMLPAPPKVLISIQYCLVADPDEAVAGPAREGLLSHPFKVFDGALDGETHPKILEFLTFNKSEDSQLVEKILFLRQLNDRSMAYLAEVVPYRQLEIIAGNQERLLMAPELFDHIKKNPASTPAMVERLESFLRMYQLIGAPETAAPADESVPVTEASPDHLEFEHGFEEDSEEFEDELTVERDGQAEEEKSGDLWSTISKLPIPKKIKLAFFGNGTARQILVRDRNKVVASAVMKNARITDSEVVTIAKSRNVCDDVLREITRNKEWFKRYAVKVALVNNPKTPAAVSIRLVNQMMMHDLKALANNRNIPSVVTATAKQALKRRQH